MNNFFYIVLSLLIFLYGNTCAESVILLKQQVEGVISLDSKFKIIIVIHANAIIDDANDMNISPPKMAIIVINISDQSSWESNVGDVPKPGGGSIYLQVENVTSIKQLKQEVVIDTTVNGLNNIIVSKDNFSKLNKAISKNRNIPGSLVGSWKGLAKNWFNGSNISGASSTDSR